MNTNKWQTIKEKYRSLIGIVPVEKSGFDFLHDIDIAIYLIIRIKYD